MYCILLKGRVQHCFSKVLMVREREVEGEKEVINLHPNALSSLVHNVYLYPRVVRMLLQHCETHVYGFHEPLCLQVIERQSVPCTFGVIEGGRNGQNGGRKTL